MLKSALFLMLVFKQQLTCQQWLNVEHQELEPWTSTLAPATMHGIGPIALEAQHTYLQLQNLLTAIGHTQSAHQKLSMDRAQADSHSDRDTTGIQAKHAGLKLQQQLLPVVQQRLSKGTTRPLQLADL